MAPVVNWARCKIEIYERPIGLLDDHFRTGWVVIRSAASQSFTPNGGLVGDLATIAVTESGTSDGCGYEKGSLNLSTDTYKKFRARLKSGGGYYPKFSIYVKFTDGSDVYIGWTDAPSEMTVYTLSLPAGKTVTAIQLFARAGGGANNQTVSVVYDYVTIIKDNPKTPDEEVESLDVELCATTAISGFKFVLLNDKGLFTEKPSVGDFVMIYLAAPDEKLDQKLISGYITDKEPSGEPDNPIVTITGECLGQVFNDKTFTKKYTSSTLISQIVKDIRDQELTELTKFSVEDTDNSITPEFNEEGIFNLLKKLADASRKGTVYGYDFYVDPAGDMHFVPNPKYTCAEKIYAGMFYDDFRGNLDKWEIKSGTWVIENEELSQSDQTETGKVLAGNPQWTDYKLEARIKILEVPGPDGDRAAGVYFRRKDDNNFYYLLIAYQSPYTQFRLMKIVGGSWYDIQNASATINLGQWYDFKVEVNGTSIKCYLDGTLKVDVTDSSIDRGRIGCLTTRSHSHFDNVSVKAYNEPAYNIKKISVKESLEDVGNDIKLLIREAEYNPRDKDGWTENLSGCSSPQTQVAFSVDNADKKVGNNSIKGEWTTDPGLKVQLRKSVNADITFFEKIKFWDKWSVSGPVDWWIVRLYTKSGDFSTDYYERKLNVGQSAPASKPWSTEEVQSISDFTKTGNPSNIVVSIEITLENNSTNIGTGYLKVDGLHFALDPLTKTASDSASQGKYGVKKRNFEDLTIIDQNFAQFIANALCQLLKNPIKHVWVEVPGKAQEGYRPPAQVIVSSAKDNIHYEYFKILRARHHYIINREEAPLYICNLDLIAAKKTDGTFEVPMAWEPPSLRALKSSVELAQRLDVVARKGYYWY